jgi:hypothetical protein
LSVAACKTKTEKQIEKETDNAVFDIGGCGNLVRGLVQ